MRPDDMFSMVNPVAAAAWLVLIVFPRRSFALRFSGMVVPALLAIAYTGIIVSHWAGSEGGFSSLAEVATLFRNPWLLLAGWIHYLAFDLLIGCWEVKDAKEHAVPHVYIVLPLILTFLFGPAGWLSYLAVRWTTAHTRRGR